jgi:hypothetical protein
MSKKGRKEKKNNELAGDALPERLRFLLDKVEWDESEMRWMLAYLDQTDDEHLRDILYEAFRRNAASPPGRRDGFDQKALMEQLHKKLFG